MIEMLVVMSIFILVSGLALFVSLETFRGSVFRSDRTLIVSALQRARAQSMNNKCFGEGCTDGKPHGVKVLPNKTIIIFQGATYATRDSDVDAVFVLNIATSTGSDEFVFSRLAGSSTGGTIALIDQLGHASVATVGPEGNIIWTN